MTSANQACTNLSLTLGEIYELFESVESNDLTARDAFDSLVGFLVVKGSDKKDDIYCNHCGNIKFRDTHKKDYQNVWKDYIKNHWATRWEHTAT